MLLQCGTVDQNVVKEDDDKPAEQQSKVLIHGRLKGRRRIGEAERHEKELEMAIKRPESSFIHVIVMYPDLLISRT